MEGDGRLFLGWSSKIHSVLNMLVSEDGKHMPCFRVTRPNFLGKPSGSRRVSRWDSDEENNSPLAWSLTTPRCLPRQALPWLACSLQALPVGFRMLLRL